MDLSRTDAYDYDLPEALIASAPAPNREQSRLLVIPTAGPFDHTHFEQLPSFLRAGDVLVRNTARVLPARLHGRKSATGGQVELLVLAPLGGSWFDPGPFRVSALARSSKPLRAGTRITLSGDDHLTILARHDDGVVTVSFDGEESVEQFLERCGEMPLPPYIRRARSNRKQADTLALDRDRYQTVYAHRPGAVAAPTAGLHFTEEVLQSVRRLGATIVDVHLDVGVGTFRPISAQRLSEHELHEEQYVVSAQTEELLNAALEEKRRILAVGTTAIRVLEDQARRGPRVNAGAWSTRLFLRPGVPIRWVDGLITNFHLPKSSLLTLVCALGGYSRVMAAYREAIAREYRFYSYGDATLIWRQTT